MVLFTEYTLGDRQQNMDMGNCTILDIACSSTVCRKTGLDSYIDSSDQSDKNKYIKLAVEECSCLGRKPIEI